MWTVSGSRFANLKLISHNRSSCCDINRKPRGIGYCPRFLAHLSCLVFSSVCKEAYLNVCDVSSSALDVRKKKPGCGKILLTINIDMRRSADMRSVEEAPSTRDQRSNHKISFARMGE